MVTPARLSLGCEGSSALLDPGADRTGDTCSVQPAVPVDIPGEVLLVVVMHGHLATHRLRTGEQHRPPPWSRACTGSCLSPSTLAGQNTLYYNLSYVYDHVPR